MTQTAKICSASMFLAAAAVVAMPVIAAAPAGRAGGGAASSAMNATMKPKVFPPVPEDPIERPEFVNKPHPITKSITSATAMVIREQRDGSMLGLATDVIASVPAATRTGQESTAVFVPKQ